MRIPYPVPVPVFPDIAPAYPGQRNRSLENVRPPLSIQTGTWSTIPCTEFSDNAANLFFDFRRVTGEDLPAQCHTGTLEYLGTFVEVAIDIIDIYERDLQRNRIQHGGQLRQGQTAAREGGFWSHHLQKHVPQTWCQP